MKTLAAYCVMASLVAGVPMMVGCEREIAREERVKTDSDGDSTRKTTTVKETPDGGLKKETTTEKVDR